MLNLLLLVDIGQVSDYLACLRCDDVARPRIEQNIVCTATSSCTLRRVQRFARHFAVYSQLLYCVLETLGQSLTCPPTRYNSHAKLHTEPGLTLRDKQLVDRKEKERCKVVSFSCGRL